MISQPLQRFREEGHSFRKEILHIDDPEGFAILDDDVIHVHGLELAEFPWERDEVDGRALVELEEVRVFVVSLPP